MCILMYYFYCHQHDFDAHSDVASRGDGLPHSVSILSSQQQGEYYYSLRYMKLLRWADSYKVKKEQITSPSLAHPKIYKHQQTMFNLQQCWRGVDRLTGKEAELLMHRPSSLQQEVVLIHAHRHLVSKGVVHKALPSFSKLLRGSTSALFLEAQIVRLGFQLTDELPKWRYLMQRWKNFKQEQENISSLVGYVSMQEENEQLFDSHSHYIIFLNLIASDILSLVFNMEVLESDVELFTINSSNISKVVLPAGQILQFLAFTQPKSLYNTVLRKQELPHSLQNHQKMQCLYSDRQLQMVVKRMSKFSALIKILIKVVLSKHSELHKNEQKILMQIVINYFILHHHQKNHEAIEIFIECFNKISESVRFAMTDELTLFFRMARMIGKQKMVSFLQQKSKWLKETLQQKLNKRLLGYPLSCIDPYSQLKWGQKIKIDRGKTQYRYIECLSDHTLLFLRIIVQDLDIDVRIIFEGDILKPTIKCDHVVNFEKMKGENTETILLPQKGIYVIEFNNNNSWINGKSIIYQRLIFDPLTFKEENHFPFMDNYLLGMQMNSVSKQYSLEYSAISKYTSISIASVNEILSFSISCAQDSKSALKETYRYQTDSQIRFVQRLNESLKKHQINCYLIDGKIRSHQEVQKYIDSFAVRASPSSSSSKESKKEEDVLIQIPLKY